jgi:hypothetical protein
MRSYETSSTIAASADEVPAVFRDVAGSPAWDFVAGVVRGAAGGERP